MSTTIPTTYLSARIERCKTTHYRQRPAVDLLLFYYSTQHLPDLHAWPHSFLAAYTATSAGAVLPVESPFFNQLKLLPVPLRAVGL